MIARCECGILFHVLEILFPSRVAEDIEVDDLVLGKSLEVIAYEMASDETASAGNE
jgi:hypothetical protein